MNVEWSLPTYVHTVMEALRAAGHRGYLVGGSLRDLLRGEVPHDFDMTTDATPEEMLEIFASFRVIETGLKHGTLTVLSEGNPVEVTTHRVDGDYKDARHPECVNFTRRLEQDLSRRDFTVNAMAWNPETGLVDLFDGQGDLARGVLRAVGDPETRFCEDALRILRAFRFCARLGFEIEPQTLRGAAATASGLARISVERIFAELRQLLEAPHADAGLAALCEAGCEKYVFFDTVSALDRSVRVDKMPQNAALRLAVLLPALDAGAAKALARRWHAPNAFGEALAGYLTALHAPLPQDLYEARRFVCGCWHYFKDALAVREGAEEASALCQRVARDGSAVEIRRLAVNGKELQEHCGVAPRHTAALLQRLQDLVWKEPERNKKPLLLAAAKEICEREGAYFA